MSLLQVNLMPDDTIKDTIIRMQSQIIDKLFLQLLRHVPADELDNSEIVHEINVIAELREPVRAM